MRIVALLIRAANAIKFRWQTIVDSRLFSHGTRSQWTLREFHDLFASILEDAIADADIDETELDEIAAETIPEAIRDSANGILDDLKRRWPVRLRHELRQESGFRKRTYARWKKGFDLLRMMILISHEIGSKYNEVNRTSAVAEQDYSFEALVSLHARALRVAHEVEALLQAGFPDGAVSRWRTLHELAVIMTFLGASDSKVSERFLRHRVIVSCDAMDQYREFQDRANLDPISDEEYAAACVAKQDVIDQFGPEMKRDYGWAADALCDKSPNLRKIEECVGLDYWRPRFKWACDDIHGGYRPVGTTLGEAESVEPILLAGASNSAFTDPAHMMAVSLNIANGALLLREPTIDLLVVMNVLDTLSAEVGEVFLEIDVGCNH